MAEDNDSTYSKFFSSISETQGWKPSPEEGRGVMVDKESREREGDWKGEEGRGSNEGRKKEKIKDFVVLFELNGLMLIIE